MRALLSKYSKKKNLIRSYLTDFQYVKMIKLLEVRGFDCLNCQKKKLEML